MDTDVVPPVEHIDRETGRAGPLLGAWLQSAQKACHHSGGETFPYCFYFLSSVLLGLKTKQNKVKISPKAGL